MKPKIDRPAFSEYLPYALRRLEAVDRRFFVSRWIFVGFEFATTRKVDI
jgi:hypothetical protein